MASPRARALIDLAALRANLQLARRQARGARVMAVVKANAYGHGLLPVARTLTEARPDAPGADALGVACMAEALALREGGVRARIVLLEGVADVAELRLAADHDLEVVVHHDEQLTQLERGAGGAARLRVWVKLDTGMHRLGFPPGRVPAVHERLAACRAVQTIGWMTHFACADDLNSGATAHQLECFAAALGALPGERSAANSGALLGWPESRLDWVRPGIMLYGVSPFLEPGAASAGLRPVMTLQTRLIAVHALRKGDALGYGGAWVCPEDMTIGVAAIGYGDGYPRHAASGTPLLVNGRRAALAGRVSMDMIGVDLRGHPEARPGDAVVLWGSDLAVEAVAREAGTIAYELLCAVNQRVSRIVRDDAPPSASR